MQECKMCKASWNIAKKLATCPFCGADLNEHKQIESIEAAFKMIVERHGKEVFGKTGKLIGLLGDYAPNLMKERKLVKVAIEAGAYEAILNAANVSNSEIELTIKKYVAVLNETYFIDELWARKALQWCAGVLNVSKNEVSVNLDNKPNNTVRVNDVESTLKTRDAEQSSVEMTIYKDELVKYSGNSTNVIIPKGIRIIRSHAFYSDSKIQKVTIPSTVKIIGKSSFAYCFNLQQVEIDEGIEEIGDWAFVNCKRLNKINLPNTLTKLGELAFQGCESLKSIVIPSNVKEIKAFSFHGCSNLNNIEIPKESVIDKDAFDTWHKPKRIQPDHEDTKSNCKGWLIKNNNTMVVYDMKQEPETWNQRDERKKKWNNITKVIISEGISEIKTEYFSGMKNLREVEFPQTLKKIGFASFSGCSELRELEMPDGVLTISARAFQGCENLEKVKIPLSVKYIGDNAFSTGTIWVKSKLKDVYVNSECAICSGNEHIKHISV